jgi:hypothetical protein
LKTKHGIFLEIITDITQELGANSKFKGNSFVDCKAGVISLQ